MAETGIGPKAAVYRYSAEPIKLPFSIVNGVASTGVA